MIKHTSMQRGIATAKIAIPLMMLMRFSIIPKLAQMK